ncbi:hypothetical protein AOLI_G00041330 [Acnodon oligacanthus]
MLLLRLALPAVPHKPKLPVSRDAWPARRSRRAERAACGKSKHTLERHGRERASPGSRESRANFTVAVFRTTHARAGRQAGTRSSRPGTSQRRPRGAPESARSFKGLLPHVSALTDRGRYPALPRSGPPRTPTEQLLMGIYEVETERRAAPGRLIELGLIGAAGGRCARRSVRMAERGGGGAAGMERAAGSLQEQALRRRERLKALKDRQLQGREPADGEPESKRALEEAEAEAEEEAEKHRDLKLRNYTPEDEELKERQVPKAKPASVEDKVKDQLEAANPEPVIEEVDLANLAPRKPDWDLKRDVAKKLEKLEKRTQKAIAELIRERLKGSEEELAGAVGAVAVEEGDSD